MGKITSKHDKSDLIDWDPGDIDYQNILDKEEKDEALSHLGTHCLILLVEIARQSGDLSQWNTGISY